MDNQTKCVGDLYVSFGIWYGIEGNNITFCKWCVDNGCVIELGITSLNTPLTIKGACNCDCPHKGDHKLTNMCIEEYTCEKHQIGIIGGCAMGKCKMQMNGKMCSGYTPSTAEKYCRACSAYFHKCLYCGDPK